MQWKRDVAVLQNKGYQFKDSAGVRPVADEDSYIVAAVQKGIIEDEALINLIIEEERTDDISARLRLAGFLIEYGEYIEEMQGHQIIEI